MQLAPAIQFRRLDTACILAGSNPSICRFLMINRSIFVIKLQLRGPTFAYRNQRGRRQSVEGLSSSRCNRLLYMTIIVKDPSLGNRFSAIALLGLTVCLASITACVRAAQRNVGKGRNDRETQSVLRNEGSQGGYLRLSYIISGYFVEDEICNLLCLV